MPRASIFSLTQRPGIAQVLARAIATLQQQNITVVIDQFTAAQHPNIALDVFQLNADPAIVASIDGAQTQPHRQETASCTQQLPDIVFSIGGDGNFVHACKLHHYLDLPIVGVNFGRLGFLADLVINDFEQHVIDWLNGRFSSDSLPLLCADCPATNTPALALNDITLHTSKPARLIEFEVYIDGQWMCSMHADGFIVATTTGSTAYALSAGGAIMHPNSSGLQMIPIAAQMLSNRAVIVPLYSKITLAHVSGPAAQIAFDGFMHSTITVAERFTIYQSAATVKTLRPPEYDFYAACRAKLGWLNN